MPMATTAIVLVAALGIDTAFGYPKWLLDRIGHPVTWIGSLIAKLDRELNHEAETTLARKASGAIALLTLIAAVAGIAWAIERLLASSWLGLAVLAVTASTLLASRSLYDHVADVALALDKDGLDAARRAVGKLVGRNPEMLDEAGVARASIESLAENASDGVVAPAVWFLLLGFPGLAVYKAINTADSMIGHRTPRHEAFGWASARLDDLVNLPASRLTAFLLTAAAAVMPGASASSALSAMARDAAKHRSPNAGWPESATAGALGLKLNGPKVYGSELIEDAYMGDGRRDAGAPDIRNALRLSSVAWIILVALVAALALIARG